MNPAPSPHTARKPEISGRQIWAAPNREGRDTLFLLACITATLMPHAGHLPLWASVLTGVILLWRAVLAWQGRPLPGRWLLVLVMCLSVTLTWVTHHGLLGREAGLTLLTMLMALKTMELRARRDAFVVFFLGFFLVLTQFLYSQSLLIALWTLLCVWALLSAVVLAQMPVGQPTLKRAAGLAARTTLLGLPVMVLLFLLFPRIAPLWGVPADAVGRTGLSSNLDLGALSEVANDDSIAMRLRFQGPPPAAKTRYFRGQVLTQFDGRTWRPTADTPFTPPVQKPWRTAADALRLHGTALNYELTLEPLRINVLPLLEMSPEAAGSELRLESLSLRRAPELQWIAPRPITERLRLNAQAYPDFQLGPLDATLSLESATELPPGLNPRTLEWAAALRQQPRFAGLDEWHLAPALIQAVLQHIAQGGFIYTLSPGAYGRDSAHLIDEFWFDRKLGFCEHFAAAFVVIMRAQGLPARVVTGFQGMDAQMQDGYWIVRNSHAHAWAEVWIKGRGWQRVDPTAAVAPDRILQGLALQAPMGALGSALGQLNPDLWQGLHALQQGWEAVNNRWQQQVLNYSRQSQFDLLRAVGVSAPDWLALGQVSAALIGLLTLAGGTWTLWHQRPHDAWSRQRAQIIKALRRCGVAAQAHQGPRQWAALLQQAHGAAAGPAQHLLLELERSRYGAHALVQHWRARLRWRRAFWQSLAPLRHTDHKN
ncbi:transglutaminase family protein [Roseateles koreensis]|uniref:DUF3488 and transglutaminase-like domain-containing protein n=1 Tax=Roseateles koreensis TaxID=2987526 RepID=A0ABT5KX38_9BURK|nr:DUF3488 and transglutaminase-like domain-containing protein [Roseateles koreensis]MDC8786985.1 DUF3488 and transglutaminase-like domain-containing protein [Roseateles koreensis]